MTAPTAPGQPTFETARSARLRFSPVLIALIVVGVVLIGSTLGMWAYYGTAVFYEMLAAGLAACL